MSGGIEEFYNLKDIRDTLDGYGRIKTAISVKKVNHKKFWDIILGAQSKHSVVGCYIEVNSVN